MFTMVAADGDVAPTGRLDRAISVKYQVDANPKAVRVRFIVRVSATGRIGAVDTALNQPTAAAK